MHWIILFKFWCDLQAKFNEGQKAITLANLITHIHKYVVNQRPIFLPAILYHVFRFSGIKNVPWVMLMRWNG
jgi:hypothetical protein